MVNIYLFYEEQHKWLAQEYKIYGI